MDILQVSLFGKFQVQSDCQVLTTLNASRVQDLFCYLLLYRHCPHPREKLAALLWGDTSTTQSKRYLRKTLWQLQTALNAHLDATGSCLLLVEPEWLQINPQADLWLDVALFERHFATVSGIPGQELSFKQILALMSAVGLYQGDLLEGCYQEWCLYERERLQHMYLIILDKLMGYCEACHEYEAGLNCGTLILRYDKARERTHRRMMRLHFMAGHRTAALRQYEHCVTALAEELGVGPAKRTVRLCDQIRSDQADHLDLALSGVVPTPAMLASPFPQVLERLKRRQMVLADIQRQIQQDIQTVEQALNG